MSAAIIIVIILSKQGSLPITLFRELKAMPDPTTQKLTIAEYKEAQTKLSELMKKAVTGFAAAQKVGDLVAAKAWSETLVVPIASLKEQFLQLSPQDQFSSE